MTRLWVGRPHYGWPAAHRFRKGSSYSVKRIEDPDGPKPRRIGFAVAQSRRNRRDTERKRVASQIQAIYQ